MEWKIVRVGFNTFKQCLWSKNFFLHEYCWIHVIVCESNILKFLFPLINTIWLLPKKKEQCSENQLTKSHKRVIYKIFVWILWWNRYFVCLVFLWVQTFFSPPSLTRQTSGFNTRQVSRLITCDVFEGLANTRGNIRYTTRSYSGLNAEKIFLSPDITCLKKYPNNWLIYILQVHCFQCVKPVI